MIEVRLVHPGIAASGQDLPKERNIEFDETRRESGNRLEHLFFKNQYESAKLFLQTVSDTGFNAKASCRMARGEFATNGYIEVMRQKDKRLLESAIEELLAIGRYAKYCNNSSFCLVLALKTSRMKCD